MRNFQNKAIQSIGIYSERSWEGSIWANTDTTAKKMFKLGNKALSTDFKYTLVSNNMLQFRYFNWHHAQKLAFSDQTSVSCGFCCIGQRVNQQQQQRFSNPQIQRRETGRYELCCRIETLWDKHSYRKCKLDESPLLLARIRTTHFR